MNNIVGQTKIKESLQILIDGSDIISHILFCGPAGLGKTTLAEQLAKRINAKIFMANGATIQNQSCVVSYLIKINRGDILFIDECHRLSPKAQESLYTVLENFRFDTALLGSYKLPQFTCVGATTEKGKMLKPFLDRFANIFYLNYYSDIEIKQIIDSLAKIKLDSQYLAEFCRGVPRKAKSYLAWLEIYSKTKGIKFADTQIIDKAMSYKGIYSGGLTDQDVSYMKFLSRFFKPVGIKTITNSLSIDIRTIETIIEPFLLKRGLLIKTPQGRILNLQEFQKYDFH